MLHYFFEPFLIATSYNTFIKITDSQLEYLNTTREDPREWKWMFLGWGNGNSIVNSPIKIIPTLSTIDEYSKNDYNFHHLK